MKKPLSLLAALCLGGILASGTAQASSYYYTTNTSQTITNTVFRSWQNFSFDKFNEIDPVKGIPFELLGVIVTLDYSYLTGTAVVSNRDPVNISITDYRTSFEVKYTNAPSIGYNNISNSIASIGTDPDWNTLTIAPGETKSLDINTGQYFIAPSNPNVQYIASTYFDKYTGVGTLNFSLRNLKEMQISGDILDASSLDVGAFTSMTVTYTYGVPEPSTYILFGLGGLALVVAYRRKRAA